MALTNASRLADFGTGIGTQGAILKVDNADQMVGIGTTDPTSKLEVKGDFKVSAASTLSGAVKISDSTNSTSTTTGALIVTGGVGIGASLHVDGDVSIGGTLTYEDVTNIDSVGLITARSGINVSGGEFKVGTALTVGSAGVTTISARVYIRSSFPRLDLEDTDSDSDFAIINSNGDFMVWDQTNSANRFSINSSGVVAANSDLEVAGSQYITDSIIHTGDTNTKIRFPAADTITAETGGSERLRITSGGDVGINTTVPAQKLHVYGNSGNTILAVGDNSTVQPYVLLEANETDNVCTLHSRTNNALTFKINNSERARIDASGQLGIGTNSPSAQFVVSNSGNNGFEFNPNFNSNNSIIASYNRNPATDDYTELTLSASQHIFAKGGTEYGRFNANGRLGIGTNNPQLNLHIHAESSNASFAHFTNSTTGVSGSDGVSIGLDSDENAVIYNYESSAIRFATGGTERARIDSSGNLSFAGDTNTYISHPSADQLAITVAGGSYPIARFGTGGGGGTVGLSTSITLVTNAEKLAVRGYSSFKSVSKDYAAIYLGSEGDTDGSANALMLFNNGGANRGGIGYVPNTGELRFNNQYFHTFCTGASTLNGTERVRITAAGFVGINNTSPDAWLHIDRSDQQTDNHGTLKIENTSTDTAFNAGLTVMNYQGTSQFMQWTQSGLRMGSRIVTNTGNGHVSITRGGDTVALTIDGANGNFTGSSSANISDGRLKKNIVGITSATATLKQLVGKTFKWIPEAKFDTKTKYGFIAQEVKSVIPDLVYQDLSINRVSTASTAQDYGKGIIIDDNSADFSDDSKSEWSMSVETNGIIPILVEAFKELETRISALESS